MTSWMVHYNNGGVGDIIFATLSMDGDSIWILTNESRIEFGFRFGSDDMFVDWGHRVHRSLDLDLFSYS